MNYVTYTIETLHRDYELLVGTVAEHGLTESEHKKLWQLVDDMKQYAMIVEPSTDPGKPFQAKKDGSSPIGICNICGKDFRYCPHWVHLDYDGKICQIYVDGKPINDAGEFVKENDRRKEQRRKGDWFKKIIKVSLYQFAYNDHAGQLRECRRMYMFHGGEYGPYDRRQS